MHGYEIPAFKYVCVLVSQSVSGICELFVRNKVLANENKANKAQLQTLLEKGRHDDELIDALFVSDVTFRLIACDSFYLRSGEL